MEHTLKEILPMCPHNDFEIIYYKDGVMLRRCRNCQKVELHLEWIWAGVNEVKAALDFFQANIGYD